MLWILFAALLILAAVLLARAARSRPDAGQPQPMPAQADAQAAAAHLSRMIQKRTVSSRNEAEVDAEAFAAFIALLPGLYPETHRVLTRETVNRHALLYRWKGREPGDPAVLMAHYDVVDAPEDGWRFPPFGGVIDNGVLWGRGALDTKGTLAGILEAVEQLVCSGFTPAHDVYLSFADNEEIGGDSTPAIVELFRSRGISPALVVDEGGAVVRRVFPGVSSPVALVGVAEKGVADVELEVRSPGGHTSAPPRSTAADRLAQAVVRLHRRPFPARFPKPTVEMLETLGRHTPFLWRLLFANLWLFRPLLLLVFTRLGGEMNAMARTTLAVTQLEGSRGVNVLASRARAAASVRIAVGGSVEGALARIRQTVKGTGVQVRAVYSAQPSPISDTAAPAYTLLSDAIRATFPGAVVSPYVMLGGSDSRHFAEISPYVYRFSPFELTREERETLHAVNEAVPIEKLKKCVEFYLRLIRSV